MLFANRTRILKKFRAQSNTKRAACTSHGGKASVQLYCSVYLCFINKIFRRACPGSGIQVVSYQNHRPYSFIDTLFDEACLA